MFGYGDFGGADEREVPDEEDYRQHRVNIKVQLDQAKIDQLSTIEMQHPERVVFTGTQAAGTFNLHTWEPGFCINDQYNDTDAVPKILTALNGFGSDEMAAAKAAGDEKWLSKVMAMKIRYVGHPTGEWNADVGKLKKTIGAQIQGVRPFLAFEAIPVHSLVAWYVPTITEAQQLLADPNRPDGVGQMKVGLIVKPYNVKDVWDLFYLENKYFLQDPQRYEIAMGMKSKRLQTSVISLKAFHDFVIIAGVSQVNSWVRDNLFGLHIPTDCRYPILDKTGALTQQEFHNAMIAYTSKMGIMPNVHYPTLAGVKNDQSTNKFYSAYRTIVLRGIFEPRSDFYMFGFSRKTPGIPGIDPRSNNVLLGTPHGDMIQTIHNASREAFAAISNFIYFSTHNILGRAIKGAQKGAFGSLI